jgi:putative SOS response-associated peptidase YedK
MSVFGSPKNLQPRYNIAPTTMVDVARHGGDRREGVSMRWGLISFYWKKPLKEFKFATFNARAQTVDEAPMFRDAFRRRRRCIIPASGFYEWTGEKKDRVPDAALRQRRVSKRVNKSGDGDDDPRM